MFATLNRDKSAARFCCQWVQAMFCNFYLVKSGKFIIVTNSAISEAREKISTDLESLEF